MSDEKIPVHQLEHAEPTVIHHPEEDMTVLARWLQRGMEQGSRFWLMVGGLIVVLVAVAALTSGVAASKPSASQAWGELTQAKTVEDRLKIAEAHPNTPVALWAKLLSAQEEYANGVDDLTSGTRKETAGPRLKAALKLFEEVAKEAPKDSSQSLSAMLGIARTMEARNDLSDAIEKYRELASKYPNTPEAKQSLALAKALEEPVNIQFYKELYAYKAPANPNPGGLGGPGSIFPNLNLSPGSGPGSKSPAFDLPVPAGLDAPPSSKITIPTPVEMPKAEPPKTEPAKTEPPKAETPPVLPSTPDKPAEPPKTAEPAKTPEPPK